MDRLFPYLEKELENCYSKNYKNLYLYIEIIQHIYIEYLVVKKLGKFGRQIQISMVKY
jgi:hypothetical protein